MSNSHKPEHGCALWIDSTLRENRNKLVELLEKKDILKRIELNSFLIKNERIDKGETFFIHDIYENQYKNKFLELNERLGKLVDLQLYSPEEHFPISHNKLTIRKDKNEIIIISILKKTFSKLENKYFSFIPP